MRELKISRPELIGIICGFAAAATLTGSIMMFNVWPALTTPPLVIEAPGRAEAPPPMALPKPSATTGIAATPKTTSNLTLTAPIPATLAAPVAAAAPVPASAPAPTAALAAPPAPTPLATTQQATPPPANADAPRALPVERPAKAEAPEQATAPAQSSETPSAPASPATSAPAQGETQSTGGGATAITITYAATSKNAEATARVLAAALHAKGFATVETGALDKPVDANEIKFFHAHDKEDAAKVKAIATALKDSKGRHRGYDLKDASAADTPPAPGHIEIWLRGS